MKKILKSIVLLVFLVSSLSLGISFYSQEVSPIDNGWLPFFGLGFSVLFWINVVLFIISMMKKHIFLIIPLVGLVYACPSVKNYYKLFPKSDFSPAEITELKMMTYNVRIFNVNENLNGNMRDSIFNMMSRQDINLACFQEFYYSEKKGKFDTESIVQEKLGLLNKHKNYTHHMSGGMHSGVAMFTSLPVVNRGVIEFKSDINNTCIYMDVKIDSDTVRIYNGHFASIRFSGEDYEFIKEQEKEIEFSKRSYSMVKRFAKLLSVAYKKRTLQLQSVLDHISASPYPVVLAGDFNDTPVSHTYNQTRKYLTDSFVESGFGVGATYIGDFPSFRIDYIFHSEELEGADYTTLDYSFSDHRPIYCKLRVKP